jgi:hypothetical protein
VATSLCLQTAQKTNSLVYDKLIKSNILIGTYEKVSKTIWRKKKAYCSVQSSSIAMMASVAKLVEITHSLTRRIVIDVHKASPASA